MFLVRLDDKEKKCFYRLAQIAAEANGEVDYEEINFLECYRQEMSLEASALVDIENVSTDDIVGVFSAAEESHKRIVMFETIAFMYVDGSFDEAEKNFTYQFANQIGFPKEEVDDLVDLVKNYVDYLTEIAAKVLLIN